MNHLEEKKQKKSAKKKKGERKEDPLYLGDLSDRSSDKKSSEDVKESISLKEAILLYWREEFEDDDDRGHSDGFDDEQDFDDEGDFDADFTDDDDLDRDDMEDMRGDELGRFRGFERIEDEDEEEEADNKKLKAIEIYNGMPKAERNDILQRFMDELNMTENAAKTYYQKINSGEWTREDFINQDEEPEEGEGEGEDDEDELEPGEEALGEPGEDELGEPEDPDRQGLIRTVKSAHLVYKRQAEDGSYEELWTYNIDNDVRNELKIRRDILAGTDIPPNKRQSNDGTQHYDLWTLGNVQMLHIEGLPN